MESRMPKLYHSHYSGWTRSKAKAISACCKGTREDGGGAEEDVIEVTVPRVTMAVLLTALNEDEDWPRKRIATIQHGRRVKEPVSVASFGSRAKDEGRPGLSMVPDAR